MDLAYLDVGAFPWALPTALFDQLYPQVVSDKGQAYEHPVTWPDVQKIGEALGLVTSADAFGKRC